MGDCEEWKPRADDSPGTPLVAPEPPEFDGGGAGRWPSPAIAIVGSPIAAKSMAEIVTFPEVFITLSNGLRPAHIGRHAICSPSSTPVVVNNKLVAHC